MLYMMPRYAPKYIALDLRIPKKNVSYVKLGWQTHHQDIQFPLKPHFDDIPDLPNLPDGVTKYFVEAWVLGH